MIEKGLVGAGGRFDAATSVPFAIFDLVDFQVRSAMHLRARSSSHMHR